MSYDAGRRQPIRIHATLRLYLEVEISEFQIRNVNWNALRSRISDPDNRELLTNPELNIQNGAPSLNSKRKL